MPTLESQIKPFLIEATRAFHPPFEKYEHLYSYIQREGLAGLPQYYFPTSITSGGFRLIENDVSFAKDKNYALSQTLLAAFLEQTKFSNERYLVILPPDLGTVPTWEQLDYNFFWLHVISGLYPCDAQNVEKNVRDNIDASIFNDHTLSRDERRIQYIRFVQEYVRVITKEKYVAHPVSRLIQLVDPKSSLGCYCEELLARSLHVPISRVFINNMDYFHEQHEDLMKLIRNGVDIPAANLDGTDNPLILVSQPALF